MTIKKQGEDQPRRENTPRYCLTRREFIAVGSGALVSAALLPGCGGDKDKDVKAKKEDLSAKGTPWADTEKALDLTETVHLADIYHYGEYEMEVP